MWKQLKRWWATEGAIVQLQGQSNRLLADIGLERETLRARLREGSGAPETTPTGHRAELCETCWPVTARQTNPIPPPHWRQGRAV
jgi:hypothetical protein